MLYPKTNTILYINYITVIKNHRQYYDNSKENNVKKSPIVIHSIFLKHTHNSVYTYMKFYMCFF